MITCFWILAVILVEKVLKCIMAIIDYKKLIIYMSLKIGTFDSFLNTIIYAKNEILFSFWQLQNIQKLKTLIS